jgi:excisionase family DNA binding protein
MKATWLTVPELAAVLRLSVVSVRRAYWRGHLPVFRIGRMVRFDLDQVRRAITQNGHSTVMTLDPSEGRDCRAPGGASRRRDGQRRPRLVNTGAQTTRFILWIPRIL